MRLPSPAARITTDRGSWVRPPPLRSGAKEWLGFLATVDALPLAAGGDKRDSPPDRDRAGLGLGRAQAKLAELAAHEGPDVHLGIRMRLVLGVGLHSYGFMSGAAFWLTFFEIGRAHV